jgi:AraC-like DNA-binding protein
VIAQSLLNQVAVWTAKRLKIAADEYLSYSFERESPPQVKELAASLGFSRTHFGRHFASLTDEHPSVYLRRGQIECAKRLLCDTDLPMNLIAYKSGFGRRRTFYRAFKRETGTTPESYRLTKR